MIQANVYFDEELTGIPPEHFEGLLELIREAWDPTASRDTYLSGRTQVFRGNPYCAQFGYPIALLTDGDRVVGHDSGIPCAIWCSGRELPAHYQAGLYLLREYRGKGLGLALPRKMNEVLETKTGFFVVPQQIRTHQRLKWLIPGRLPEYVKILKPDVFFREIDLEGGGQFPKWLRFAISSDSRFRRTIGSSIPSRVSKVHRTFLEGSKPRMTSQDSSAWVSDFDNRLDDLWDRVKGRIRCAQVRSSAYLNWHFPAERGWRKLCVGRNDRLAAYGIVYQKVFEKGSLFSGLRFTSLIDLLYELDDPLSLQALLNAAETDAVECESDVLLVATTHPRTQRLLVRSGYLPIPRTVYFTCQTSRTDVSLPECLDEWYMTRGDADAAGSLGP